MRDVYVVLFSGNMNAPNVELFASKMFYKQEVLPAKRGFWTLDLKIPDNSSQVVLHVSPTHGKTDRYVVKFRPDQTFGFVDISDDDVLAPFCDFFSFFNHAIQNLSLRFSFNSEDQLDDIWRFLFSFPEEYQIWALIYICNQPWFSLFQFDEGLSELIKNIVEDFIKKYFESEDEFGEERKTLRFEYVTYNSLNDHPRRSRNVKVMCESADVFLDALFCVVRRQLGIGYSLLLSVVFDFDDAFPDVPYFPSLASGDPSAQELIQVLFENAKHSQTKERLALISLLLWGQGQQLEYVETLKSVDCEVIARIVHQRMMLCTEPCLEPLKTILEVVPTLCETLIDSLFVPFEWLATVREVAQLNDDQFNAMALESINNSIPVHIARCFANVSEDGALFFSDPGEQPNVVVQPGSIIQDNVKFGPRSMLMSGSIALSGSELSANCFAPRNGVVLPLTEVKPISPKAELELPVNVELGVSIADNVGVSRNAHIGAGSVLESKCFLSKNVAIGKGSVIRSNEHVKSGMQVPKGFTYSWDTLEFATSIPKVITRHGGAFRKRMCGFVDMKSVLDIVPSLLSDYLSWMRDYPRACGKEIGLNCQNGCLHTTTAPDLFSIFGANGMGICIEYWKSRTSPCEPLDQVMAELCNLIIQELPTFLEETHVVEILSYVLYIWRNIDFLIENGADSDAMAQIKKQIFELADENGVRYSLVNSLEAKHVRDSLAEIITSA